MSPSVTQRSSSLVFRAFSRSAARASSRSTRSARCGPEHWPGLEKALRRLERHGLLLGHDRAHPCITSLVAGAPVEGSWWSHPLTHEIYWVYRQLEHREDLLQCKLLAGKMTFVQRRLWPAVVAVATGNEPWQRRKLSSAACSLLRRIERDGRVRTDRLPRAAGRPGDRVRELEKRLLVFSDEIHTETGAHAKCVETWDHWRQRTGLGASRLTPEAARAELANAARGLYPEIGRSPRLPWPAGG